MNSRQTQRAFSLVELIVVVAVMGALGAALVPSITVNKDKAMEKKAVASAEAINIAKARLLMESPSAREDWGGDDVANYTLLKDNDLLAMSPKNLGDLEAQTAPCTFKLKEITEKVEVWNGGSKVNY